MSRWTTLALLCLAVVLAGCSQGQDSAFLSAMEKYQADLSAPIAAGQLASAADATPRQPGAPSTRTDAVDDQPTWLALASTGLALDRQRMNPAAPAGAAPTDAQPGQVVSWRQRRGPAYPGDFWRSFGRDGKEFLPILCDDTRATVTNPASLVMLGLAGAAGIALSGGNGNDQVERHFAKHGGDLNGLWDTVGDVAGNPGAHFAVAGAMYLTTLYCQDTKNYEVSKALLEALALNGLATMGLKVAARTESPNGDEFGWPSGHTSSSFTFATVMHEYYGPWVGLPLYALAGFIGYERLDARNHDFSDVISGALIGIAIGHAVSQNHKMRVMGMDVIPYADPARGTVGLALGRQW